MRGVVCLCCACASFGAAVGFGLCGSFAGFAINLFAASFNFLLFTTVRAIR